MNRSQTALLALIALPWLLAGCATPDVDAAGRQQAQTPAIVLAGARDGRVRFAALFDAELRRSGDGEHDAARWLHDVDGDGDGDGGARGAGAVRRLRAAFEPRALDARFAARAAGTVVLMVPGLFGDCVAGQSVPFGDGVPRTPERSVEDAYRQYDDLGLLAIRMVPLPGRASSEDNGKALAATIVATAARPEVRRIVLVGYSKGTADALHALEDLRAAGGVPRSVHALVSVAGIVTGTPLADRHRRWYEALATHLSPFDCGASRGGEIESLGRAQRVAWLAEHRPPDGIRYLSVIARADPQTVAPGLRPFLHELSAIDPRNDGQIFAADAVLPASELLAEVRADHWALALPLERHPNPLARLLASSQPFPREALFRAILRAAVADD